MKTYKGFNADWTCRGYQFAVGNEYTQDGPVQACERGFHACEYPLDVFRYYPPGLSVYAETESDGTIDKCGDNSKIASSVLRVKAQLSISDLVQVAIDYTFARAKPEDNNKSSATDYRGTASATGNGGAASATGYRGAASATGYRGAASATGNGGAASATGEQGAASATGYRGAASATGEQGAASATGEQGAASATGIRGKVKGGSGCALLLVERDDNGNIIAAKGAVVGKTPGIKADTWYCLISGKFVAVQS